MFNQAFRRIFTCAMISVAGEEDDYYYDDLDYEGYDGEAIACFEQTRQENRALERPIEGAIHRFTVAYLSGLPQYPEEKPEDMIGMNVMWDRLAFRKTGESKEWFHDYDIYYESMLDICIENKSRKDAEHFLKKKKHAGKQENHICITFLDEEGKERKLCLAMLSGYIPNMQNDFCCIFMKLLQSKGILERIFENGLSFQKERYELPYVQELVPAEYRELMWQIVEKFQNSRDKMFFHIFEFSSRVDENGLITEKMVHKYPQMDYCKVYEFPTKTMELNATIQVIEQKDICKMIMKPVSPSCSDVEENEDV